ncbi:uncharacterized protein LOC131072459 [Cryptomeria japonica]|uniref:uncharacterized protein LOC131072459 n=1 Tax=Cryptomeria japonica TaxID=3369 RepID=UPI0025AD1A81|nr:uncharacterized protein LOC131072459 [Cryptomeria japonica]
MVKPSPEHAFLYYSRALNSDIVVMIQSMGAVTLPAAYDIAIKAENSLIQAGKIAPRPPMPTFPDIQPSMPLQVPPLVAIPVVPALDKQKQQASTSQQAVNTLPPVQNVQILPRGQPAQPKEHQKVQSQSTPAHQEPTVPKVQHKIEEVLKEFHEGPVGGHFAARTTALKIMRVGYYWPEMFKDAQSWVKKSEKCSLFAGKQRLAALPLQPIEFE